MTTLDEVISTPVSGEYRVCPRIVCEDGTTLSVQASRFHYCSPRNNIGPWEAVEVGFPSVKPPDSWEKYAEDWTTPCETVYGRVPIELVRAFIDTHGGEHPSRK